MQMMKRKGLAVLAAGFLTVAVAVPAGAQVGPFPDVPTSHWAADAIEELAEAGLFIGYPDGNFAGYNSLTRYEAAQVFARILERMDAYLQRNLIEHGDDLSYKVSQEALYRVQLAIDEAKAELKGYVDDQLANFTPGAASDLPSGDAELSPAAKRYIMEQITNELQRVIAHVDDEMVQLQGSVDAAIAEAIAQVTADRPAADAAVAGDLEALERSINQRVEELSDAISALSGELETELAVQGVRISQLEYLFDDLDARVGALEDQVGEPSKVTFTGSTTTTVDVQGGDGDGDKWLDPRNKDFDGDDEEEANTDDRFVPGVEAFEQSFELNTNVQLSPEASLNVEFEGLTELFDRSGDEFDFTTTNVALDLETANLLLHAGNMTDAELARGFNKYALSADGDWAGDDEQQGVSADFATGAVDHRVVMVRPTSTDLATHVDPIVRDYVAGIVETEVNAGNIDAADEDDAVDFVIDVLADAADIDPADYVDTGEYDADVDEILDTLDGSQDAYGLTRAQFPNYNSGLAIRQDVRQMALGNIDAGADDLLVGLNSVWALNDGFSLTGNYVGLVNPVDGDRNNSIYTLQADAKLGALDVSGMFGADSVADENGSVMELTAGTSFGSLDATVEYGSIGENFGNGVATATSADPTYFGIGIDRGVGDFVNWTKAGFGTKLAGADLGGYFKTGANNNESSITELDLTAGTELIGVALDAEVFNKTIDDDDPDKVGTDDSELMLVKASRDVNLILPLTVSALYGTQGAEGADADSTMKLSVGVDDYALSDNLSAHASFALADNEVTDDEYKDAAEWTDGDTTTLTAGVDYAGLRLFGADFGLGYELVSKTYKDGAVDNSAPLQNKFTLSASRQIYGAGVTAAYTLTTGGAVDIKDATDNVEKNSDHVATLAVDYPVGSDVSLTVDGRYVSSAGDNEDDYTGWKLVSGLTYSF